MLHDVQNIPADNNSKIYIGLTTTTKRVCMRTLQWPKSVNSLGTKNKTSSFYKDEKHI